MTHTEFPFLHWLRDNPDAGLAYSGWVVTTGEGIE